MLNAHEYIFVLINAQKSECNRMNAVNLFVTLFLIPMKKMFLGTPNFAQLNCI